MSNYIDQPADADPYAAGSFGNYNPSDGYQPSDSYMASEGYGVPVSGDAYGSAHDPYAANDPYAAPAAHDPYAEPAAQQQPAAIRVSVAVVEPHPPTRDRMLRVVSRVDRRPGSTVAAPRRDREVGLPFAIPAALWRPHHVYVAESEIRRQPGVDAVSTELVGGEPRQAEASAARIPLFVLR